MERSLFPSQDVESVVGEVDIFRNDILGPAAFFAGLTALQFSVPGQASAIGTISVVFILLWGYSKAPLYKAAHDRYYARFGNLKGWLVAFYRNPVLFVGFAFLSAVATGYITPDNFGWVSLAKLLGPKP
jgi:hypothetical protein